MCITTKGGESTVMAPHRGVYDQAGEQGYLRPPPPFVLRSVRLLVSRLGRPFLFRESPLDFSQLLSNWAVSNLNRNFVQDCTNYTHFKFEQFQKGNFCHRTSRKRIFCCNTPPTPSFAEYHYEFDYVCHSTPRPLF